MTITINSLVWITRVINPKFALKLYNHTSTCPVTMEASFMFSRGVRFMI